MSAYRDPEHSPARPPRVLGLGTMPRWLLVILLSIPPIALAIVAANHRTVDVRCTRATADAPWTCSVRERRLFVPVAHRTIDVPRVHQVDLEAHDDGSSAVAKTVGGLRTLASFPRRDTHQAANAILGRFGRTLADDHATSADATVENEPTTLPWVFALLVVLMLVVHRPWVPTRVLVDARTQTLRIALPGHAGPARELPLASIVSVKAGQLERGRATIVLRLVDGTEEVVAATELPALLLGPQVRALKQAIEEARAPA